LRFLICRGIFFYLFGQKEKMLKESTMKLEDEGSSLGTIESDEMNPPHSDTELGHKQHKQEGAVASLIVEESDWRMVTDECETRSLTGNESDESGLLILEGEEEAPASSNNNKSDNESVNLSIPGTDSVPTIVGSLEGLPGGDPSVATKTSKVTSSRENDKSATTNTNIKEIAQADARTAVQLISKRNLVMFASSAIFVLLVPTLTSVRLYQERNSLLLSVAELEDKFQVLKDEASKRKKEELLNWESGCDNEQRILLDNCWVSAKANIQLGECAQHAKQNLIEFGSSLWEHLEGLENSTKGMYHGSNNDREEPTDIMIKRKLSSTKKVSMDDLLRIQQFLSNMETTGKSQWKEAIKDAKSVFKTFFPAALVKPEEDNSKSYKNSSDQKDVKPEAATARGITDLYVAASSLSAAAEAIVAAVTDKATAMLEIKNQQ